MLKNKLRRKLDLHILTHNLHTIVMTNGRLSSMGMGLGVRVEGESNCDFLPQINESRLWAVRGVSHLIPNIR